MIHFVEDDSSIRELVVYTLKATGYDSVGFASGQDFFRQLSEGLPELVLLDIMLPGEDGLTILKKLKSSERTGKISVIMVTAKGSEYDKVIGLDSGADDYITKPFGMMELVSRIKAVMRRTSPKAEGQVLTIGEITLTVDRHSVTVSGSDVNLTLKEFELLKYLMINAGLVLSRDSILENLWGYDFDGETRTVDVHIRTLRQKLGEAGTAIETVRGVGYRLGGN